MKDKIWRNKMKKINICKIFVVGIIALFIGVGAITSAFEINIDVNEKSRGNSEPDRLDGYTERFSIVMGKGHGSGNFGSSVNFSSGDIFIIAYTTEGFYSKRTNQIYIEFFIGALTGPSFGWRWIFGVAIGDIDWK
jgi:hypothetical protein